MKNSLLIFIFAVVLSLQGFSNDLLKQAEKAYDTKKYKEAIEAYEKLVDQGFKSYELYFNLGNAYYRDKQLGKAIFNYERARKLNPNDEDVRINLGIATAKTIDKIDAKENFFISAVKSNLLSSFDTKGWATLNIVGIIFLCAFIFLFISTSSLLVKRLSFVLALLLLVGSIATYFLGYSALKSKYDNKFAIVTAREARIMNEPTTSATSKFSLHEGTKIRIVENNGDWVLIKLDNGNEGWVKLQEVGII